MYLNKVNASLEAFLDMKIGRSIEELTHLSSKYIRSCLVLSLSCHVCMSGAIADEEEYDTWCGVGNVATGYVAQVVHILILNNIYSNNEIRVVAIMINYNNYHKLVAINN